MDASRQTELLGETLRQLILASFGLAPDDLATEVTSALRRLGAHDVLILLCDYDQRVLVPYDHTDRRSFLIDDSPPGEVFRTDTIVAERVDEGRRVWIPMRDSSEREGVLGVIDDGTISDDNWLAVAGFVGELVASKMAYGDYITVRKRPAPFTVAAEMRWAMLPPLTFTSPEVTITGFLQPSDSIAGDAFDYAVTGGCASLAIFDAMGHGIEASRIANLALGAYRNSRRAGNDLAGILRSIDELIVSQFGDDRFVTGQVATLDLDSGHLEVANAGHQPPLLLRHGSPVQVVPCAPSAPAGLGCEPTLTSVDLEPGDAVLFRTDGVVEARSSSGDMFSDERLSSLMHELFSAGLPPSEVLRQTVHAVVSHRDGRPGDDASMLLVAWKRVDSPARPGFTER